MNDENQVTSDQHKEFLSATNHVYQISDIIAKFKRDGCLDDFKIDENRSQISEWHESFNEGDVNKLFSENPSVFDACSQYINSHANKMGQFLQIDDVVFKLIKNIVDAGRPFRNNWNQAAVFENDRVSDALRGPIEELQSAYKYDSVLQSALNSIADLVNYDLYRCAAFTRDVDEILEGFKCSAGFIGIVSHLFSVMNTARCTIAYANREENIIARQPAEDVPMTDVGEGRHKPNNLSFFCESAQRSLERSLMKLGSFSGTLNGQEASFVLKDKPEGFYFLRYSENHHAFCASVNRFNAEKNVVEPWHYIISFNAEKNNFKPFIENDEQGILAFIKNVRSGVQLTAMDKGEVLTILGEYKDAKNGMSRMSCKD